MKNYRDSDYAANKYKDGIVYRFLDETTEVTLGDYLRENPGMTPADFAEIKALSDEIYFEQDRSGYRQTYKDVPLDALAETTACAVSSPEHTLIALRDEADRRRVRADKARAALNTLTEVQRRRYLLHFVQGLSTWQIAKLEGVNQSKIMKSLQGANKKIKKVLTDG